MNYDINAIMAAVEDVREENARLRDEAVELRGRLRESRREARRLGKIAARGRERNEYWHQMMVAVAGAAVGLTSLLFALVAAWGCGMW